MIDSFRFGDSYRISELCELVPKCIYLLSFASLFHTQSNNAFLPPTWRDAVPKNIQIPIYVFPAPRICIWNVYFVCYKAEPHIGHRPNEPPSQWEAFIAAFISREVLLATHSKSEQV